MTPAEVLNFKDSVRARDGWKCLDCGMTNESHLAEYGTVLHVHRKVPGGAYDDANSVTVCQACHGVRHRGDFSPFALGGRSPARKPIGGRVILYAELPATLVEWLKGRAERNLRTLTSEVRSILEEQQRKEERKK